VARDQGGELGRELSNEPMLQGIRTSWHGVEATTGGDRCVCALRREHGHHVVIGLVAGGAGLVTGACG
jgi:hypothetical protein